MNTLTQLISIQAFAPLFALILVGSITLHAYWKHKKENKPCLLPNTCRLLEKEIYLLNQRIDETSDTDQLEEMTHRLLKLEEHLVSLHDYQLRNYSNFDWRVCLVLLSIIIVGFGLVGYTLTLIF